MRLWLKVRRARASAIVILLTLGTIVLVGGISVPMPGILSFHGLAVPISLLAPLALSTTVGYGLNGGDDALESVAVRRVALLDTAYAVTAALVMLAAGVALQSMGLAALGYGAGRNALGFVGLVLVARRAVGGHAATLLPAAISLFAAVLGADAGGDARWWAWMVSAHDEPRSWVFAAGLLCLGAVTASGFRLQRPRRVW